MVKKIQRAVLRVLGAAIGLVGIVIVLVGWSNPALRPLGAALILGGAFLIGLSKRHDREQLIVAPSKSPRESGTRKSIRLAWSITALALIATVVFLWFIYRDAEAGYHEAWPLYSFAISGQIFLVTFLISSVCSWRKQR